MFRDYENDVVENLYKNMYIEQTYFKKIQLSNTLKYNKSLCIIDAIYYLNKVTDSSDPDTDHEQIYHGYSFEECKFLINLTYNFLIFFKLININ